VLKVQQENMKKLEKVVLTRKRIIIKKIIIHVRRKKMSEEVKGRRIE